MIGLLVGGIAMCALTIALFFLRFWRSTGDRFFLFFSLAFAIEAAHRVLSVATALPSEDEPAFYFIRLCGYGLILFAIVDKNRRREKSRRKE
ncbi:hypothetical protein E4K72_12795 [Oxalobacteraceae bacterium OM1]|nr:hypothetical protein E4K72_12795 [Oxalobacteraceae bacterium OM1]